MIELATPGLQCAYLPLGELTPADSAMLGAICFSGTPPAGAAAPQVMVNMPALASGAAATATCEIWRGAGQVLRGVQDGVHYGHDEALLFGAIQLDENAFSATDKTPLQQAAQAAYRAVFDAADALGFPHILRFWNYMADINGDSHGMERYRQFNTGRQDGFLHSGRAVSGGAVPAASAVGTDGGPLTVYFLGSRTAHATAIENPRQVSAYDYPPEYGPRSPTFSRASVALLDGHEVLFLSGTASIVGHRSLHAGDVLAQTRETLTNIAAMVEQANRSATRQPFSLAELCCKIYVRHPADAAAIEDELRQVLGADARLLFLRADICRRELLLEIEATAAHPLTAVRA